jgi:hypothetical protein
MTFLDIQQFAIRIDWLSFSLGVAFVSALWFPIEIIRFIKRDQQD